MKLRFTCTSFLPGRSPAWNALAPLGATEFGDYGDWPMVLTAGDGATAVVWVAFLEDLLPPEAGLHDASAAAAAGLPAVDAALAALDQRLQRATAPTVVGWLVWRPESAIRRARGHTGWDEVAERFAVGVAERVERFPTLSLLPLDPVFAAEGMNRCLDARNFYASRCRLSLTGLKVLSRSVADVVTRLRRAASKVLVLDCDNTIWGGVVGEVGLDGLVLGQDGQGTAFVAFQRAARVLAGNGIVLAISSKNEEADVWTVFDEHPSMVLKRDDIAAARIDWREKSMQIQEIAADLDLGLDSFVFWDDNPVEREKVRATLPMVTVPEPPADVVDWPAVLCSLTELAQFRTSVDDRKKTQQYKSRAAFVGAARDAADATVFLASIGMKPRRLAIDKATLARAAQLCAKTNQFNLRLARHDEAALERLCAQAGVASFLFGLSDKFGDHGIIGLAIAVPTGRPGVAFLDTFLMSCRVLGRHLEAWALEQLRQGLIDLGYSELEAEFVPGERNTPARELLSIHGFAAINASETLVSGASTDADRNDRCYSVNLDAWHIPHLEIFEHEPPAVA